MQELSRDLRSFLALFLPLPAIVRLRRCCKAMCKQWEEPLQRQLVACARRSIDAVSNECRLLLLFHTGAEGRFCFQRRRTYPGEGAWMMERWFHSGVWDETRGWFVCVNGDLELKCEERFEARAISQPGIRSAVSFAASGVVGPKIVTVSGLSGGSGSAELVRESHGPFSFTFVAFYKLQCEYISRGIK
jgi:hypothetical protein